METREPGRLPDGLSKSREKVVYSLVPKRKIAVMGMRVNRWP